jgi:hypothetical protein
MSSGSPSEDEIKRQNECLKKCGDDNLAIETKYVQLFTEKKISAEQAVTLLAKAHRTHDECTARCQPRSHTAKPNSHACETSKWQADSLSRSTDRFPVESW